MKLALSLSRRDPRCEATVLYFHPWEFDPDQPRCRWARSNRFRTYVGIGRTRDRLAKLLSGSDACPRGRPGSQAPSAEGRLPRFRPNP